MNELGSENLSGQRSTLKNFVLSVGVSATLRMTFSAACTSGFGDGSGVLQRGRHVLGEKEIFYKVLSLPHDHHAPPVNLPKSVSMPL